MSDAIVLLCTCADQDEALRIANSLVESRQAACVNILPAVRSIYRWKGNIETAQEVLLLIKTTHEHLQVLQDVIAQLHSYDTPEIIALPILSGSEKYLSWLREQVDSAQL